MDFNLLLEKISKHYIEKLPFVIFSTPGNEKISAFFQTNNQSHRIEKLNGNGFVFAPFDYGETAFFIPETDSEILESEYKCEEAVNAPVPIPKNQIEKNKYIKLLNITIESIKKKKANKIVISRFKDFDLQGFSLEQLLKSIFSKYPNAFRYVWFHPETGIWCGATPETLVQIENSSFKTMALAGTQPLTKREPVLWGPKELDEQQLVTDAITNSLQKVTSVLKVSNPHTHRAGSLLHLRTDITGVVKNGKATLATIAAALHPTPAICGAPQKVAKEFIIENEGYNREFYTGFLGPISENGASATLMVNLRCMKISDNVARIFAGGGITLGSQPEEEWQETQNKMQIMLQVLQPML
jgi:isochorismate synthase